MALEEGWSGNTMISYSVDGFRGVLRFLRDKHPDLSGHYSDAEVWLKTVPGDSRIVFVVTDSGEVMPKQRRLA